MELFATSTFGKRSKFLTHFGGGYRISQRAKEGKKCKKIKTSNHCISILSLFISKARDRSRFIAERSLLLVAKVSKKGHKIEKNLVLGGLRGASAVTDPGFPRGRAPSL